MVSPRVALLAAALLLNAAVVWGQTREEEVCGPTLMALPTACDPDAQAVLGALGVPFPANAEILATVNPADLGTVQFEHTADCCKAICAISNTVVDTTSLSCGCTDSMIAKLEEFVGGKEMLTAIADIVKSKCGIEIYATTLGNCESFAAVQCPA